jgi:hypothetical protein
MTLPVVLHTLFDGRPIAVVREHVAAVRPLFEEDRVGALIYMSSGVRHEVSEAFEAVCLKLWPTLWGEEPK